MCVRVLYSCGAKKVIALVLAVNQIHGNYWSNEPPCIVCPACKNKMRLLANSQTKQFFYRCYNCKTTVRFNDAMNMLINIENSKLKRLHSR